MKKLSDFSVKINLNGWQIKGRPAYNRGIHIGGEQFVRDTGLDRVVTALESEEYYLEDHTNEVPVCTLLGGSLAEFKLLLSANRGPKSQRPKEVLTPPPLAEPAPRKKVELPKARPPAPFPEPMADKPEPVPEPVEPPPVVDPEPEAPQPPVVEDDDDLVDDQDDDLDEDDEESEAPAAEAVVEPETPKEVEEQPEEVQPVTEPTSKKRPKRQAKKSRPTRRAKK